MVFAVLFSGGAFFAVQKQSEHPDAPFPRPFETAEMMRENPCAKIFACFRGAAERMKVYSQGFASGETVFCSVSHARRKARREPFSTWAPYVCPVCSV